MLNEDEIEDSDHDLDEFDQDCCERNDDLRQQAIEFYSK